MLADVIGMPARARLNFAVFLYQRIAARSDADGDFAAREKTHSEQRLPLGGDDVYFAYLPKPLHEALIYDSFHLLVARQNQGNPVYKLWELYRKLPKHHSLLGLPLV